LEKEVLAIEEEAEEASTEDLDKCSLLHAASVVPSAKCLSSLEKEGRFTARIVSEK
jgi:hypothetical protein